MSKPLPKKRKWFGYAAVAGSLLVTYALWIGSMWAAQEWHENPWIYPAKVGSHGALVLMCWAFILSTRFRPVERLFGGLDKVYKAHRRIGEIAFVLIFLHPIFLAVAFSKSLREGFNYLWFSEDWVRNTGLLALALFILLIALSICKKLAYHLWKKTHAFFALLLVLIVVHAVLAKGEIMQYPVLAIWHGTWVTLGLVAYAYIHFLYRFIGPQYDYITKSVNEIGDAITEIYMEPVRRPLTVRPGQFIYVSFEADSVSREPHPFSISSPPESPQIRLSIKELGDWTHDVARIKPGRRATIWGPYGYFSKTLFDQPQMPVVMIAGGIGITPFLGLVGSEIFAHRPGQSTLIYSVENKASAVYREELEKRSRNLSNLKIQEHYSDDMGYIDRAFLEKILDQPLPEFLYMICGPPPMMDGLRTLLSEAGVSDKQIIVEDFNIR